MLLRLFGVASGCVVGGGAKALGGCGGLCMAVHEYVFMWLCICGGVAGVYVCGYVCLELFGGLCVGAMATRHRGLNPGPHRGLA